MAKRVTIQDLAKELNTTASTISRALKDHPAISKSMKERVVDLAQKRNYKVNALAAGLRVGRIKTIGVIVPRINRDFFSNIIAGIEDLAFEKGYNVVICQTHDKIAREKQYINTLLSTGVSGLLISLSLESSSVSYIEEIKRLGIPLIFFDRVAEDSQVNKIQNNDKAGAYKAVCHLLDNGYKKIAHFAGPDYINVYKDRKQGYLEALKANNIKIEEELIITSDVSLDAGRASIQKLMELPNPPDAVFSASDYSALGALLYLKEHGIDVPQKFGLVGYSNENFTALVTPGLTSVDQHGMEIGKYAAKVFFEEIEETEKPMLPRTIVLDPELVIRESSSR